MVRHIILWTLKESDEAQKKEIKKNAKIHLEGLLGQVPSLRAIKVHIAPLPSSNCDMMLETEFDDAQGLKDYAVHPAHVAVADRYVRPFTQSRVCLDFEAPADK